jgi:hypothetical protein
MKMSVPIAAVIGGVCLLAPIAVAQDQTVVRHRRAATQATPGALPASGFSSATPRGSVLQPQFGGQRFNQQSRPQFVPRPPGQRTASPLPSSTPRRRINARQDAQAAQVQAPVLTKQTGRNPSAQVHGSRETPERSPTWRAVQRSATKTKNKASSVKGGEHAEVPAPAGGEHIEHQAGAEHQGSEGTIIIPTRTPPVAGIPMRTPEGAAASAPTAPPSIPPVQQPAPSQLPPAQARSQRAPILNDLSQEERTRLQSAHQNALHDPNLAASRARYLDARKEFREKLRDALLKADPSVQPILEKIRREKPDDR